MMTSVISGIICFVVCPCMEKKIILVYTCQFLVKIHFFVQVWGIEIMWWILSVLILNFWFPCEGTSSVLQERKWWKWHGLLRCMKRQISSIITTHIPPTVRSMTLITFISMYSGGLAVRNHYRRRSCSQLGSHCPWNMFRYFISISFLETCLRI